MKKFFTLSNTRRFYKTYIAVGSVLFVAILLITAIAYAHINGITGETGLTTGCTCHNTSPNSNTTVSVSSQSGSFTMTAGTTATFTITVANSGENRAGVDIAVKTTEGGETNAGSLSPATGSGLQALDGELTHTQPKDLQNGQASFTFTWTAPSTAGTYYLRATGNAVNGNGQNDAGDQWNRMNVQAITVEPAPEVAVTSPNGGEAWCSGSTHNITWTSSGVQNVKIELSSDAGQTYPTTLVASLQASLGTWAWNIPANQPDGSQYRVRISDAGNATTNDASNGNFSISSGTSITSQPQALTVCQGQPAAFSVTASGAGLSYQWRFNGTNINGATQSSYNITSVTQDNAGAYDVIVTGACGNPVTSSAVNLAVNTLPSISEQPVARAECTGQTTTFTVTAAGTGLTYQWRKDQQPINNATDASYTISSVKPEDAGTYDVVVSGTCSPAVTSSPAKLTVDTPPAILAQPTSVTTCSGVPAQLKVGATGSGLQFQWRKDGLPVSGATDSIYNIASVTGLDAGSYDVVITGTCAPQVTSNLVTLTVAAPVSITQQPATQTAIVGSNVEFSIKATGTDITYQWRKGGAPLNGKTQSSLVLNNVTKADEGSYDVLLSNTCGTVTSSAAALTVITTSGGPVLSLSVTSIDFGMVRTGSSKDTVITAAIKNIGDASLTIASLVLTGANAGEFSLLDTVSNLTIEQNATANLRVRFSPVTGGEKSAKIDFTSNSPVNPSVLLSGLGGFVSVQSSVGTLDFGSVKVGSQKDSLFGLQNSGNIAGTITSMTITGPQASSFQVVAPVVPTAINSGQTLLSTVRFTPLSEGPSEADLVIAIQDVTQPITVHLLGNGISAVKETNISQSLNLMAYPNPSKGELVLSFEPDNSVTYDISVIDVFGITVKEFHLTSGDIYQINWDGSDSNGNALPSGVYIVLLKSGQASATIPVSIAR